MEQKHLALNTHMHRVLFIAILCVISGIALFIPGKTAHAAVASALKPSKSLTSYTLTISNPGNLISQTLVTELQGVFNYSYPKLVQRFGAATVPQSVTLTVYTSSDGSIAYTSNAGVFINAVYQNANLDDLGWFTHELTHVVQSYSGSDVPGWFTEGMADYSRYYYAPAGANPAWWQIPGSPTSSDSYQEGYGPSARFLIWLQQRKSATIVDQLNHAAQTQQVFLTVFQQITGGTVDQLWAQYVADPTLTEGGTCQGGFTLSYVPSQWSGGFNANMTIRNTGSSQVNAWSLVFTFPNNQQVTQAWNGIFQQQGQTVTITNASYNGAIPVNASVYPGFTASWSDSNANPTVFTFNGQPCTVIYS